MDPFISPRNDKKIAPRHLIMLTLQVFQTVVLTVIVCILISLSPQVSKTLGEVSVTVPEMKTTVERLTWMVPEVTRAIEILDRVCVALGMSNCHKIN